MTKGNKVKFLTTFPYTMGNLNNSYFKNFSNIFKIKPERVINIRRYSTVLYKTSPNSIAEFVNKYDSDCFSILVIRSNKHKLKESVYISFSVNLPFNDSLLIKNFIEFFSCGVLEKRKDYFNFSVKDFTSISTKVIPFFNKYNIQAEKQFKSFNL